MVEKTEDRAAPSEWISTFLDSFANLQENESPYDHMRRRLLVYMSFFFSTIIALSIAQRYFDYGIDSLTWAMLVVGIITVSPLITLRLFSSYVKTSKWLSIGGLASLALLATFTEGISSPALAWIAAIPLFATLLVGVRLGVLTGLLGSLVVFAFFLLAYFNVELPSIPDDNFLLGGRLISLAGLSFSIGMLGFQFEKERKRTLESSLRQQANFQVLIEASPEGIVVLKGANIIYANPGIAAILGRSTEQVKGQTLSSFAQAKHVEALQHCIAAKETKSNDDQTTFDFVRKDGELVKLAIDYIADLRFKGAPSTLVMLRDLSEQFRLEAQLRVTDRLSSVCSLAAGMAHEINNPIAFVKGNLEYISEILEENGLHEELVDLNAAVNESMEGVLRVAAIVQDMQNLARIQPKESGPIDLSSTVHSAINLTSHETRRRATLDIDISEEIVVLADSANLHQVLINLLINAAEAMPEEDQESNRLLVRCSNNDDNTATIEIRDSGPGIPDNELARVFDPFYTTKDIGKGTGLGLPSCQQLVSAMNGTLVLENHAEGGLVARITLPTSE